jgi:hypothetical protein
MGTIIGSVYPVDDIMFIQNEGDFSNAVDSNALDVLKKLGLTPFKSIADMNLAELKKYRKILSDSLKTNITASERNTISIVLSQVELSIKKLSGEKTKNIFSDIWGTLVDISGAKGESEDSTPPPPSTEEPKSNLGLYIGLGVGLFVIGIVTIAYLKRDKKG